MENRKKSSLQFYGGKLGAWIPLFSLVFIMLMLVITDHISLKIFWTAGFFALCISFVMAKDRGKFSRIVASGLTDPMFSTLCMIFFLAGILSYLLRQSGLINGLLWLSVSVKLPARLMPMIIFLTCAVISTSCGTAGGAVAASTPILFPLGVKMGCDPALMAGAIISGSFLGDNLAPISDTTIASATTMEKKVGDVVWARLPYSLIAGIVAAIMYIIFGFKTTTPAIEMIAVDAEQAKTLIMLVIPLVMIILMLKKTELLSVLLVCDMLAIVLNLAMKFIRWESLFAVDGPIVAGIEGMLSIVCFEVFLFALLALTKSSGAFEILLHRMKDICVTARHAELVTAGLVIVGTVVTAINTVTIVIVGPIANQLYREFHLERARGANIMDGLSCAVAGVLPYNASMMTMMSLAISSGAVDENFSIMAVPKYSFHCIALFIVFVFCILTEIGRKEEEQQ